MKTNKTKKMVTELKWSANIEVNRPEKKITDNNVYSHCKYFLDYIYIFEYLSISVRENFNHNGTIQVDSAAH